MSIRPILCLRLCLFTLKEPQGCLGNYIKKHVSTFLATLFGKAWVVINWFGPQREWHRDGKFERDEICNSWLAQSIHDNLLKTGITKVELMRQDNKWMGYFRQIILFIRALLFQWGVDSVWSFNPKKMNIIVLYNDLIDYFTIPLKHQYNTVHTF